jgi:hypothetical protein
VKRTTSSVQVNRVQTVSNLAHGGHVKGERRKVITFDSNKLKFLIAR